MDKKRKQKRLDGIADEISACRTCRKGKIGLPVPGEGNPDADLVFLGEAPGKLEAKTGRPFVGRSGKYLRSLIISLGLDDIKDVYITSPVKYLPKRGTPTFEEIRHGRSHLERQLEVIQPRVIVLLGNTAIYAVLGEKLPALTNRGRVIKRDGRDYFLTIHPAAAVRFSKFRKVIEGDFRKLRHLLGRS